MERERGLMAEGSLCSGPEPRDHQVLVVAGWELDESVDPARDPLEPVRPNVMMEERCGEPGGGRLLGREMAELRLCDRVESYEVGGWSGLKPGAGHAMKLNPI